MIPSIVSAASTLIPPWPDPIPYPLEEGRRVFVAFFISAFIIDEHERQ
jgi:hypothetical protein